MSPSLNEFRNLNIREMPETRSQTQRGQHSSGRPRAGRSRARSGHAAPTTTRSNLPAHGRSGLPTDMQNLSPRSAQRVTEGLSPEFYVDRLRSYQTSQGTYYAFQLKKPASVRIHDPVNSDKVECTCEEYQESKSACVHIYWLFNGLRAVLEDDAAVAVHTLTQGEVVKQLSGLYGLIGDHLGSLQKLLNSTKGDEAESDSDESETEENAAFVTSETRRATVRDMLSVFDRKALPSEYLVDFPEDAPASASGTDLYVPGSLEATIYRIAIQDDTIFRHLRKVITRDICASSYFRKQQAKVKELMARLDRFAASGLARSDEASNCSIPVCARQIRHVVHQIFENRKARTAQGPLGFEVNSEAAEILVIILDEVVCKRNKDIFGPTPAERTNEAHPRDHNLFMYLIGNPPRFNRTAPVAMTDDFIIDRLQDFPAVEWRHLLERLTTIVESIREHTSHEERAMAYAAKLENMLREYTADAFEPSSSSVQQRRPKISSPRESQRMRFV